MKAFFHCFLTSNSHCTNVKPFRSPILGMWIFFFLNSLLGLFDLLLVPSILRYWSYQTAESTFITFAFLFLISVIFIFQVLYWVFHFCQIILISMSSCFMNVIISLMSLKTLIVILGHFFLPEKTSVFSQLYFPMSLFGFLSSILEVFFRYLLILSKLLMIKKRGLKSDLEALCAQHSRGEYLPN